MVNVIEKYSQYCKSRGIDFKIEQTVNPYDDTTLFCPSGMQQFKKLFKDEEYRGTTSNIQSCVRMNDFDEIGDSTHLLYFNMIGLFSFRQLTVKETIDFWMSFLTKELSLNIDYVTIHPDKITDWSVYYKEYNIEIKPSDDCVWSDGEIGGYCTEFFINDVEIGNIVNPLGTCIDVGFGLERINMFVNGFKVNKIDTLKETIQKIIESGYFPGNLRQGYVLRKLLRELWKSGGSIDHEFFKNEVERQQRLEKKYIKLKDKFIDKPKEWWFDTHGINTDEMI